MLPLGNDARLPAAIRLRIWRLGVRIPRGAHQRPRSPGAASSDDLARIRRIIAALLRKAAATSFPHEAAACREKAEALRAKYGL